ncbi:nucleoside triphosphate pyrophosphatase [Teredinibacter sp. KSP-S5-2]|uniref:Maf family protein n=1 Tax=Teredinibacter sp. KSP-S5-2 TaxID=3034506 RepID=UPI0029343F64|nr:nucleoside triphosphate pyrophosphatase [Teredinibacter sp. KSP-S5-2]WNO10920.1 Maf family protein [Teredinibacter sp. KSP-S5-2]
MNTHIHCKLILASSSPYRAAQLNQLQLRFQCLSPDIDEQPTPGETAETIAHRLSIEKAKAVAKHAPEAVVIGSDQTAELDNAILGKPGSPQKAIRQLQACSGKTVTFYTGIALYQEATDTLYSKVVSTHVKFRTLTSQQINNYIREEQPLDCAGSFKCEGLGIALFEEISSSDPSALIGLPLIALTSALNSFGIDPLLTNNAS